MWNPAILTSETTVYSIAPLHLKLTSNNARSSLTSLAQQQHTFKQCLLKAVRSLHSSQSQSSFRKQLQYFDTIFTGREHSLELKKQKKKNADMIAKFCYSEKIYSL